VKYVMLICDDPSKWADLTEAEVKKAYDDIFAHVEKWEKLGRYVDGGKELQGPETARTIRRDAGGISVTDGPYTEIKELVGGFMIIEAETMEQAVETASEWPGIAKYGATVEVRPVVTH
jgi:hypothetical protein